MKHAYIPANLDLDSILESNPPEFVFAKERFIYLIGNLVKLKAWQKSNIEEEEDEFIPLNSTYLQERVRNYNQYLKYLVDNEILETNGRYVPGERSRGYKLTSKYEEQEFIRMPLTSYVSIRERRDERKKDRRVNRNYGFLAKWFNENLQIDQVGAEAYLKSLLDMEQKKEAKKSIMKYRFRQISLDKIHNGDFEYTVDDTVRRFHSNLTNLKSGLRNFLTYDGKPLCSIDVKNSQPFISTILFNAEFYLKENGKLNLITLSPQFYREIESSLPEILSLLPKLSSSIMLVKSHESHASNDLELYCTLVDKGRLYPYMSEEYEKRTGNKLNVNIPEEKKKLKDAMFLTLFSKNSFYSHPDAAMKRFFNDTFPSVYRIFSLIKAEGHQRLPIILQLVESEIMLNRVAREISKSNPHLPIYTIHDSIVTLEEQADFVQGVLKNEFNSAIGLMPSLSIERWVPSD